MLSRLPLGEQRRPVPEASPKSVLLKPGQSGLRPPGFSALPAARLAAFGFVRSSSVSSVSSNQSNDSSHSDPCRPSQRELHLVYTLYRHIPFVPVLQFLLPQLKIRQTKESPRHQTSGR